MAKKLHIARFSCMLLLLMSLSVLCLGQSYVKFPISQSGVYQFTAEDANALGFSGVENVAFFGREGMLPQQLDSADLGLQEIPSWLHEGKVYVYLASPHQVEIKHDSLAYQHHLYADTAYYFIGMRTAPKRISEETVHSAAAQENNPWIYALYVHKKEQYNLLSSGRKWYSNRVFAGGISSFNLAVDAHGEGPIYFQANVMAQASSPAQIRIRSDRQDFFSASVPSIPSTTYGLKGRETSAGGFIPYFDVGNPTSFNLEMSSTDNQSSAYLDFFLLGLPHDPAQLPFGNYFSLGNRLETIIPVQEKCFYWDVTTFENPLRLIPEKGKIILPPRHQLAVFDPIAAPRLTAFQKVELDLRDSPSADFIIITPASLRYQADRLARHKVSKGISTLVVSLESIYDNYNYGTRDVTAIRNFLADQYHRFHSLKHVLFFGKGTFDYKNIVGGRPNLVPTYSARNSLHPIESYSSDDFFGFLEWGQGAWEESEAGDLSLAIGIGRLPVINPREALQVVDKIIRYESLDAQIGPWKRRLLLVADDGDNNIHLNHSETHAAILMDKHPEFELVKLYLDNHDQVQDGAYQQSPSAKEAFSSYFKEGVLMVNYIGHGNVNTLAAERIFQVSDLENWPESAHFPLVVTATCEFGRQDSPYLRAGAEELLVAKNKGAIALLTTGRPVFSSLNFELNKAFMETFLKADEGKGMLLGDIFKATKNNSLNGPYNRNFSLLGDPTLRLSHSELKANISLADASGQAVENVKGGQQLLITGNVTDPLTHAPITSFDGDYLIEVFDSPASFSTKGDESSPATYLENSQVLFRGTGTVSEGAFALHALISPHTGSASSKGLVRFYAADNTRHTEAMAAINVRIDGQVDLENPLNEGPKIHLYANDTLQPLQKTASTQIRLLAHLEDEDGIQVTPGISQEISVQINDQPPMIITDRYLASNGSYQSGWIDLTITGLEEGNNMLVLTAFDNLGNSNTQQLEIKVDGSESLQILACTVYPNPTSEASYFNILHNRPGEDLKLTLEIYTVMGSILFSTEKRYPKAESKITDLSWIFLRDITAFPAKGTYIYRLQLSTERDGTFDQAIGKILIQ